MTNISISLKHTNIERLDDLAGHLERPRSWVINQAVEQYLEHQDWMDARTHDAIADIDAGAQLIPHEEAVKRLPRK